jgi:uncharacterized protein YdeI (YjbR/CyaY-like superfamily)
MARRDPRVDEQIRTAAPFARPILQRLRQAVHAGCPQVVETLKWSRPGFEHHGLLCGMAAFKAHCAFGFWKHALLVERGGSKAGAELDALGRITDVAELPPKATLVRYVKLAARLNEHGVAVTRARKKPKPPAPVPADLKRGLAGNARAKAYFETLSPSHKREYVEWITGARQDATRARRLKTTLEWLAQGKPRNWKYMKRS